MVSFCGGDSITVECDKRIKIEGEGHLINKDSSKRFPVKFEVEQMQTGKIWGICTPLSELKYEDLLSPTQLKNCRGLLLTPNSTVRDVIENFRNSFTLEGKTKTHDKVIIENMGINECFEKTTKTTGYNPKVYSEWNGKKGKSKFSNNFSATIGRIKSLRFSVAEVKVFYGTFSAEDQLRIKYGIINLDLRRHLQGYIKSDIGKITFSKRKDHDKTINKMKTFKTPLLSGFLNITDVNMRQFESFDSYFETIKKPVETVLELLSLAQSTYLSYCSICIYAKTPNSNSQDEYKLKRMIMLDIKTKVPSLKPPLITDWNDIYNFISPKTIQKYTDLRDKCGLSIAFEWYLESLSHGVLQSDFLLACTCLEILKDRYNKKKGNTYILPESEFEDYLPDLKTKIKDMLKEKGVNNKKAKKISGKLKCINRTSFKISLLKLLKDYNIIHNDLFPDIQKIIDNRNQITHSGKREKDSEELFDDKIKLICLIQRIFFALLGYDGYFLDQNDRYLRKKFAKFTSGGFARSAEEIPRGKNGAR